jgi:hypothetical protein
MVLRCSCWEEVVHEGVNIQYAEIMMQQKFLPKVPMDWIIQSRAMADYNNDNSVQITEETHTQGAFKEPTMMTLWRFWFTGGMKPL